MPYTLAELSDMNQSAFVAALGDVFEETPDIAAQVWVSRPFADVAELHQHMVAVVQGCDRAAQLTLIQAHPDLGSRVNMAESSVQEQASVGLNQLSPSEYDYIHQLNRAYKEKFGFPFIIAVRNHTKASIFAAFEERLQNPIDREIDRALQEIYQIAQSRLLDKVIH